MTRVTGFDIIACPACAKCYRKVVYGSVYISAWQEWSDGRRGSRLYTPEPDIRRCACGDLFLQSDSRTVARATYEWRSAARRPPGWWRRTIDRILRREPPPPPSPPYRYEFFDIGDWEGYPELPAQAPTLERDALEVAVAALPPATPPEIEIALRSELWKSLNDPYRPTASEAIRADCPVLADPLFLSNLRRLVDLLSKAGDSDPFRLGEAYRELGRFDEAQIQFERVTGAPANAARWLAERARHGERGVLFIAHIESARTDDGEDLLFESWD